jgi:hypothetical protein
MEIILLPEFQESSVIDERISLLKKTIEVLLSPYRTARTGTEQILVIFTSEHSFYI